MTNDKIYKINALAKELGVSIQTIKNYETSGILPKAQRDPKGWRYYTWEDVLKIKALYQEEIKKINKSLPSSESGNKSENSSALP
jgi:DNA-binding transcriptional MerR regulator